MGETIQELRERIDEIDDKLHDLIMERVEIVEKIGAIKAAEGQGFAVSPVREVEILRRLWNRHKGALNRDVLIRLWRELISACANLETPLNVAVYVPENGRANLNIARDYFGSYTPMVGCRSVNLAMKELTQGEANIAVLSMSNENQGCWWYALAQDLSRSVSVVAKLPMTKEASAYGEGRTLFALAKAPFEPSGDDRTLVVVETDGTLSLSTVDLEMKALGLPTSALYDSFAPDMMRKAYLMEVEGYLKPDDARLNAFYKKEDGKITLVRIIGGFPVPFIAA